MKSMTWLYDTSERLLLVAEKVSNREMENVATRIKVAESGVHYSQSQNNNKVIICRFS